MKLHEQQCRPLRGAPMAADEAEALRSQVPQWQLVGAAIERRFEFDNFHQTMAFVNAVAWVAHQQDHHPDVQLSYGHCTVRFSTHSVGGLSINDFICAARIDALRT